MKLNHSLDLERVWHDFNNAQNQIKDIPGDLGSIKRGKMDKIKALIILADRRFAEGSSVAFLIEKARDSIEEVLAIHLEKETITPPPYRHVELWEQLDLPFNPKI